MCGLVQYHQILLDAGYDDIDFIADITRDELIEVGVSKYAHLKRLMKSIGQLIELTDSGTASANSKQLYHCAHMIILYHCAHVIILYHCAHVIILYHCTHVIILYHCTHMIIYCIIVLT